MGIQNRLEKIRRQPEHIRLRWAWGLTAVCMVFIIVIWGFSLVKQNSQISMPQLTGDQENTLNALGQQGQSLENSAGQLNGAVRSQPQSQDNASNSAQLPSPASGVTDQIDQTDQSQVITPDQSDSQDLNLTPNQASGQTALPDSSLDQSPTSVQENVPDLTPSQTQPVNTNQN